MIRSATLQDIPRLVVIEKVCFTTDLLSRRSFRYMLTKAHAHTLVEEHAGLVRGYALVLYSRGTSMARLYSLAVEPVFQGQGIGAVLLAAAEEQALADDCVSMRLEIRRDNPQAQKLYIRAGYKQFGVVADYYEDHMEALRYEKNLVPHLKPDMVKVPYYQQSLEFTCGPSALIMAMNALAPDLSPDRMLELRIWREATTIFMTSGHGGCGPYGLALSAYHRGYDVEIHVNDEGALFIDSVRNPEKKEVMRLVQEDFQNEIAQLPISLHYGGLKVADIKTKFEQGGIPLVLISSYRIYGEKFPHWVVVTGFDDKYIYVHDPYVDVEKEETITDCMNMPILQKDFEHMARYGKSAQKAVLIIKHRHED